LSIERKHIADMALFMQISCEERIRIIK